MWSILFWVLAWFVFGPRKGQWCSITLADSPLPLQAVDSIGSYLLVALEWLVLVESAVYIPYLLMKCYVVIGMQLVLFLIGWCSFMLWDHGTKKPHQPMRNSPSRAPIAACYFTGLITRSCINQAPITSPCTSFHLHKRNTQLIQQQTRSSEINSLKMVEGNLA